MIPVIEGEGVRTLRGARGGQGRPTPLELDGYQRRIRDRHGLSGQGNRMTFDPRTGDRI